MKPLPRIHVPLLAPEDVIPHLGKGALHWREGFSAKACAEAWFAANDIPGPLRLLLNQSSDWQDCALLDAYLERCVDLKDGIPGASQADAMAICRLSDGSLAALAVEAKVREDFGPLVGSWLQSGGAAREHRLTGLAERIGMNRSEWSALRYQLFHRTASAMLEAQRYGARHAAMIVQSFCSDNSHFDDFVRFAEAAGFETLAIGQLSQSRTIDGINLRIGWASSAG